MKLRLFLMAMSLALGIAGCAHAKHVGSDYPYHGPLVDNGGAVVPAPDYGGTNATATH